jgi:hypothetical protein
VRAYPAAFSEYQFIARGVPAEIHQVGKLDENGCIPHAEAIPGGVFVHTRRGGLEVYMKLTGRLEAADPAHAGRIFEIKDGDELIDFTYGTYARAFDLADNWTFDGDTVIPPAEITLGGTEYTPGATAAAAVAASMRRMRDEEILGLLPASTYKVALNEGAKVDTIDVSPAPMMRIVAALQICPASVIVRMGFASLKGPVVLGARVLQLPPQTQACLVLAVRRACQPRSVHRAFHKSCVPEASAIVRSLPKRRRSTRWFMSWGTSFRTSSSVMFSAGATGTNVPQAHRVLSAG